MAQQKFAVGGGLWILAAFAVTFLVVRVVNRPAHVDSMQAFAWDTTEFLNSRGSCGPTGGFDVDDDWRMQPGRYLLTIADTVARQARRRARLWLELTKSDANSRDTMVYELYGATDFPRVDARSTNPLSPGVRVTRQGRALYVVSIGAPGDSGSLRMTVEQGVGDGFAGTWRGRDGSRGYFCAGWIDV